MEKEVKKIAVNAPILDIKMFRINDSYIELNDNGYIIDGGISIYFSKGTLTFGWNFEKEQLDFSIGEISDLPTRLEYIEIENIEKKPLKNLIGLTVKDVEMLFSEFEFMVDYAMKTERITLPTGLIFDFGNNHKIKVVMVDYELNENKMPINLHTYLSGEILVDLQNKVELVD